MPHDGEATKICNISECTKEIEEQYKVFEPHTHTHTAQPCYKCVIIHQELKSLNIKCGKGSARAEVQRYPP